MFAGKQKPIEIIDVDADDVDDSDAIDLSRVGTTERWHPETQFTQDGEESTEELFLVNSKIVGKRFYNEKLNDMEIIYLEREPRNPYDSQAIKVLSRNKIQVGHISAGSSFPNMAKCMSTLMDNKLVGGVGAQLEACSVSGKNNSYQSMCQITIVAKPSHKEAILRHLKVSSVGCLDVQTGQVHGNYTPLINRELMQRVMTSDASLQGPAEYLRLSQSEVIKELDSIWDKQVLDLEALSFDPTSYPDFQRCFASKLFPHQEKGVAWMLDREIVKSQQLPPFYEVNTGGKGYIHAMTHHVYAERPQSISGGILADTMGLGKTLSILSLILCNPPPGRRIGQGTSELNAADSCELFGVKRTLAGAAGEQELQPAKKTKQTAKSKAAASKTGKVAAQAVPPSHSAGPTLVVCPLSVISSWVDEISFHINEGTLTFVVYHGSNRHSIPLSCISSADIVITTYDVIALECVSGEVDASSAAPGSSPILQKKQAASPLQSIKWWRVVLDEAHSIRTMQTQRFKGCMNLSCCMRWALTGTIIINTIADLEAPLRFLQLDPFLSDSSLFKRLFVRPIKNGNVDGLVKLRTLLHSLALRRDKRTLVDCTLPPKVETIVRVQLPQAEREAYDGISSAIADYNAYLATMSTTPAASDSSAAITRQNLASRNVQSVLTLITRLRQCCLDLRLVPAHALVELVAQVQTSASGKTARLTESEKLDLAAKLQRLMTAAVKGSSGASEGEPASELPAPEVESCVDEDAGMECAICFEPLLLENSNIFRLCRHILCEPCTKRLFEKAASAPCPLCRSMTGRSDCLTYFELQQSLRKPDEAVSTSSNSQLALTQDSKYRSGKTTEIIRALRATQATAPTEKTVIFSSFLSYLKKLRVSLEEEGFRIAQIDGSCSQSQRAAEIRRFTNDDSVTVILCSLKAAGVGVTLTRANNVYLTDLWWAPSIDLQAIDRVHRLGQTRTVNVLRFLVSNTIDEKIYELQKHKLEMSELALERSDRTEDRLRDIQALLS